MPLVGPTQSFVCDFKTFNYSTERYLQAKKCIPECEEKVADSHRSHKQQFDILYKQRIKTISLSAL